ncbi:MFS transporter [Amycolatopsis jiangsuensis]|uniref:MFS family permease n=1 Tax=Amycolatopsis jiangsuensis TaxID=1181879 RepID=A0A840J3U9_9PSEU|nr:MFS transporter [Amycolatopsis jiangsuensis]MBB4689741.1 MFS family permease [Amycolatopsis jiangsuensis]
MPRAFRRLWTAATVSSLGDGAYEAALPLLALLLSRDPLVVSLVTAATLAPYPVAGLFAGALVDRWDRPRTMWVADLARAALLVFTVAAGIFGLLSIPVLLGVAFLLGTGQLFFDTAAQAYLPDLLARDQTLLRRANGYLRGTSTTAGQFVGPPAGSFLFALGRTVPFGVNAVSFVVSAVLIRGLPRVPVPPRQQGRSVWAESKEGLRHLVRDRLLLGLALRPAVGNLAFGAFGAVLVLFARDALGLGAAGYGFLLAAEAVGGLLGAMVVAGPLERRLGTGTALTVTALVEGGAVLAFGLARDPWFGGAMFVVVGCAMAATMVLGSALRQAVTPARLMGRVTAASRLVAVSAGPLGAVLGGWLAAAAGVRAPYLIAAGVLVTMMLVTMSMTSNRRIEAALARVEQQPVEPAVQPE